MLAKLWEQNKRFILITGGGLAAFLFLTSILGGFVSNIDGPKGLLAKTAKQDKDVRALKKELTGFWDEKGRLEAYEKHEAALRADLELPPERELASFDDAAPLNQFNKAIDRVWGAALEKANRAGVGIPEKLGPQDFGVSRDDRRPDYERHYAYLGVIRRALGALVDAGMAEIGRPEIIEEELLPVLPDDESVSCLYRGVSLKVSGSYESFVRLLKSLQAPKDFLQVRIASLEEKSSDSTALKGELEFVSFRLVEGSEVAAAEAEKEKAKQKTREKPRAARKKAVKRK
jgi:hypothetical protein